MSVCSEKTHAACSCLGIRTAAATGKERDSDRRRGSMMTWTLKRPNPPNTLHKSCSRPVAETDKGRGAFLAALRQAVRRSSDGPTPGRPPPHLVFICVTSRAACLPSMYPHSAEEAAAFAAAPLQMPSRLSPLSANCYAKIEEILATHDQLFWPTLYI